MMTEVDCLQRSCMADRVQINALNHGGVAFQQWAWHHGYGISKIYVQMVFLTVPLLCMWN